MTFDVFRDSPIGDDVWEAFCVCRACERATIFELAWDKDARPGTHVPAPTNLESATPFFGVRRYVSVADLNTRPSPEHLPADIAAAFEEGAKCLKISCFNAAAAMFRLALDIATRGLLPSDDAEGLNKRARLFLAPRLDWLFENAKLPERLKRLASVVKDDGNDGVHDGTIDEETADDLINFAEALLTEIYTMPKNIEMAEARRKKRKPER